MLSNQKTDANARCDVVYAILPGNMDHVIHVPGEHDAALTKPDNIVYFSTSRDARWTNHDRVIQILILQLILLNKLIG